MQTANETSDVIACKAKLATLSRGVTGYETAKGYLPPLKVIDKYPGWNLRILPYMGYESVHNTLIDNNRYNLDIVSLTSQDPRTRAEKDAESLIDWLACEDALLTVTEFRDASRQATATIKTEIDSEFRTDWNDRFYGVPTDYATPMIWSDFDRRYVTLTFSLFKLESPFAIYEINRKQNQYWNVRTSDQWSEGKSNTLIVSEKYIPSWAIAGDNFESNIWNGGLQALKSVPQMAAQCIDNAETPIVADEETPFSEDDTVLHNRFWYDMRDWTKPDNDNAWRGNYSWGSHHVGVIVAAMGDGSVRSINKNINAGTFYNLCASNVLPEPTEQEKALANEEFRIVELREKYATQESEIKGLQDTLKLVQNQLKTQQTKQTQLTTQITNLENQMTAMTVVENPALAAALESLQEQLTTAQTELTDCETLITSYNAAIVELQEQIAAKQKALEAEKIENGDASLER
ncbi:MAG: DUF1559 domain-containing protein [Planctomycetaceae bacterium]|nr:DUF1559 domain-containing protein [Planctomycetaceae bacterium]